MTDTGFASSCPCRSLVFLVQMLNMLKDTVAEPEKKKAKIQSDLTTKAAAVFKLGVEVTEDQIAAAQHLLRACEDFRVRLIRKAAPSQT